MTEQQWYEMIAAWGTVWAGGIGVGFSLAGVTWMLTTLARPIIEFTRSR